MELLRRKHRLPIGPGSINGTAAANRQPIVVAHARSSPIFLSNPLLPDTQSEAAIPMIVEDEVIGILDLHSDAPEGLNADNLAVFTPSGPPSWPRPCATPASSRDRETREQLARQAAMLTEGGWQRFLEDQSAGGAASLPPRRTRLAARNSQSPCAARPSACCNWTPPPRHRLEAHSLVAVVAGHLGAHLENLRLTQQAETALDEARRREEEMALINRVVTQLAAATDLTTSLQIIAGPISPGHLHRPGWHRHPQRGGHGADRRRRPLRQPQHRQRRRCRHPSAQQPGHANGHRRTTAGHR